MRRLVTALASVTFVIALGTPAWADTGHTQTADKNTYKVNSASELNREHGDREDRGGHEGHGRGDHEGHGRGEHEGHHHGDRDRGDRNYYYYPGYCYGCYDYGYYNDDCYYNRDYYYGYGYGCGGGCYRRGYDRDDYYRHHYRGCRYSSCYGRSDDYCNY